MRKLNSDEIKKFELNILISFAKYCERKNLKYYLAYGTLLGAKRHGGFIPWDDDIDVIMTRKDYNLLLKYVEQENISDDLDLISIQKGTWDEPIAKIVDKNTIAYQHSKNKIGLWIDVFPIDYYDDKIFKKNRFLRKILIAKKTKKFSFKAKDLSKLLLKFGTYPISMMQISKKMDYKSQSAKESNFYCNSVFSPYPNDVIQKDWLEQSNIEFEKHIFKTFKDPDLYLTKVYGNYMKLPPVEKRRTHNLEAYIIKEK